jgi:hypothetical protein
MLKMNQKKGSSVLDRNVEKRNLPGELKLFYGSLMRLCPTRFAFCPTLFCPTLFVRQFLSDTFLSDTFLSDTPTLLIFVRHFFVRHFFVRHFLSDRFCISSDRQQNHFSATHLEGAILCIRRNCNSNRSAKQDYNVLGSLPTGQQGDQIG